MVLWDTHDLFLMLPRDPSHPVQKQHEVFQAYTNNVISALWALVMEYGHHSPAQMTFPSIPQFSNIVTIGAISTRVLYLQI